MKPWIRYNIDDFSGIQKIDLLPMQQSIITAVQPLNIEALGKPIPSKLRTLIVTGDDPNHPRGFTGARYPSRSEASFAVMTGLAKLGITQEKIAGICVNQDYAISERFLEKLYPVKQALKEAKRAIIKTSSDWPDTYKDGNPKATFRNVYVGLIRLGVQSEYDQFKNRLLVSSTPVQQHVGELSDHMVTFLRKVFLDTYGFDPYLRNVRDGMETLALENPIHPLKDYLSNLKWDKQPRIRTFFSQYMGAENTELNKAIAFIMFVGAIRRVMSPGCKFDTMIILEGKQGSGKSTALKILASEEFFSDQDILSADNKSQMELLEGVWLYEVCELSGLRHTDIAKLKSFLSRQEDSGRPAYGRYKEIHKRQSIFIGTTNDENYLKDRTGNRRFLPVKTSEIDLGAISRDRDQLWAEAVYWEAKDEPITLKEDLWNAAAGEQEARMYQDPWCDELTELKYETIGDEDRIFTRDLFEHLEISKNQQQHYQATRIADCMRKLGWSGPKRIRLKGQSLMGYYRKAQNDEDDDEPAF